MSKIYSVPSKRYADNYEKIFSEQKKQEEHELEAYNEVVGNYHKKILGKTDKSVTEKERVASLSSQCVAQTQVVAKKQDDKLGEKKPQNNNEVIAALKSMSKISDEIHITPASKYIYCTKEIRKISLLEKLWNIVIAIFD